MQKKETGQLVEMGRGPTKKRVLDCHVESGPSYIGLFLSPVYELVPTKTNLRTWKLTCKLCGRPAHLEQILSSCGTALCKAYGVLGITGMARRREIADVCRRAESASK
ncbi:hypothetical protein DPMN_113950 [Dreissena polymorpha]|uniref:Uncharacterized protein n=1 Tax=Dreissena polymorpha TaxID=45954 RepID=A0A9D4KIC2_DREPO|nr:hypothetical protein DPMN_113950 [Dreissena polymorpha]